ncbi:MAG: hypothetical protein L6Q57_09870 [Alphaproteobacteria bacterium]|nr:hypothetical protein [Alphaproteobacteria bacterium]
MTNQDFKAAAIPFDERVYDDAWALEESTVIYKGPEGVIAVPHEIRAARHFGVNLFGDAEQDQRDIFTAMSYHGPIVIYIPAGRAERYFVHLGILCHAHGKNYEVEDGAIPEPVLALFQAATCKLSRGYFAYFRAFGDFGSNLQEEESDCCPVVDIDAIVAQCSAHEDWVQILRKIGSDPCGGSALEFTMTHPLAQELIANPEFMKLAIQIQPSVFHRDTNSPLIRDKSFMLDMMNILNAEKVWPDGAEEVLSAADSELYRDRDFMLQAIDIEPGCLMYADDTLFSDVPFTQAVFDKVARMDNQGQQIVFSQLHRFAFTFGAHAPLTMDLGEIQVMIRYLNTPSWSKVVGSADGPGGIG